MTLFSKMLTTISIGASLLCISASPAAIVEKQNPPAVKTNATGQNTSRQSSSSKSSIQVIAPQDDLEIAIRTSEHGDILLLGPDGWYRIEGKALSQGIKMFVLSTPGSKVSAFPKESEKSR